MFTYNSSTSVLVLDAPFIPPRVETLILLAPGLLHDIVRHLGEYNGRPMIIIADEAVAALATDLRRRLERTDLHVGMLTLRAGEPAKTMATVALLHDAFRDADLTRDAVVIAVGGGSLTDVVGFAAGCYKRGLSLVNVPTTLLSMVSASVGGKVGVNSQGVKNLVGMFHPADRVLIDPDVLSTLKLQEYQSGLGELLCVGVLGAPGIVSAFEQPGALDLTTCIHDALRCKQLLVADDPYDTLGTRAKLNLGHTFGHAVEQLLNYSMPHGLAVALGLQVAAHLAADTGRCAASLPIRLELAAQARSLPIRTSGLAPEAVLHVMQSDKKRTRDGLQFVLPVEIGKVTLVPERELPRSTLINVLQRVLDHGATI